MAVLRPIADVSGALGLGHVVGGADRVIGHTGNTGSGVLQVEGVPAHRHRVALVAPRTSPASAHRRTRTRTPGTRTGSASPSSPTTTVTAPDGLAPLAVPTPARPCDCSWWATPSGSTSASRS